MYNERFFFADVESAAAGRGKGGRDDLQEKKEEEVEIKGGWRERERENGRWGKRG